MRDFVFHLIEKIWYFLNKNDLIESKNTPMKADERDRTKIVNKAEYFYLYRDEWIRIVRNGIGFFK